MTVAAAYFPFDRQKAVEAAAYLLSKLGGRLSKLVLIKLLYLADRESLARFGAPICGGEYISLKHGPIISQGLDMINEGLVQRKGWSLEADGKSVRLATEPTLGALSQDDLEVLNFVIGQFGAMPTSRLYRFVHELPEYTKPTPAHKTHPVFPSAMLKGRGVPQERIDGVEGELSDLLGFRALIKKAAKA